MCAFVCVAIHVGLFMCVAGVPVLRLPLCWHFSRVFPSIIPRVLQSLCIHVGFFVCVAGAPVSRLPVHVYDNGLFGHKCYQMPPVAFAFEYSHFSCAISHTGWRGCIACLKLQVSFRTRATDSRALLRKITWKDKESYASFCICICVFSYVLVSLFYSHVYIRVCTHTFQ